ncbi:MAG: metal ABC transporter permease [Deltaproteobacteria bacterium]|nr:metal ABC transporter permease [Deltaproteobacteria bacterium]
MGQFLRDLQTYSFLQYALLAGLLTSISCGIIGSYVTVRRITYIAGAIAHCTLGGMGAARFLQKEYGFDVTPLQGAVVAALLAACIIALVKYYGSQREDTVLSAIYSIGMAIGIFFISRTGGYNEDLMSYLFGDILMVSQKDLLLIGALDLIVVSVVFIFYNKLISVCFDEEFARISGIRVELFELLLLLLIALTVVLLVQVVGIVMVVAMLTLPCAAAGLLVKRLWHMMVVSILLCLFCTTGGLAISYQPDFPAGATIILMAGLVYFVAIALKKFGKI